jgi:hypothetical protein
MSPRLPLLLVPLLVSLLAGCANAAKPPSPGEPMEAPVDMNQAQAGEIGNPFARAFVKRDLPGAVWQHDPQGTKVYRGEDQVNDYQRMLENGYDMLGYSEFFAGDVPPSLLEQHAKSINADVVLVYTKLAGEVPANIQAQQLREQARQGKTPDATEVSQNSYTYFASYWGKLMPPLLGVHVLGPTESEETDGLEVLAVINGSPADKAGIRERDILKRLGDVALDRPSALMQAARRYAGQQVEAEVQRGQNMARIPVQLNPLHATASK